MNARDGMAARIAALAIFFLPMLFASGVMAQQPLPSVPSGQLEPLVKYPFCHYKTPGPGMTFTQGIPLRVLVDGVDGEGYLGKTGKMEAQRVRFYVDGELKATVDPAPDGYNYFETTFTGLTTGQHILTAESVNVHGPDTKSWPVPITIEAPARKASIVKLTEDLVLSGNANLTWENTRVEGNGFRVRADPNWSGSVVIRNSLVIGLGSYAAPGIDVGTDAGSINIENTTFDGTGAAFLRVDGSGAFVLKNNEFRASDFIQFVCNNPSKSPVLHLTGNTSGEKLLAGNRVGSGIVEFERTSDWMIGGDSDKQSNILMGPRCVLAMESCHDMTVRGNYIHHDYFGGWSQGFALYCERCRDILAEHNIIRQSSWPVQNFSGEFRYNLVVDSGHDWVRVLASGAKFHHNLLIHTGGFGGDVNAGILMYGGMKDVSVYNNTFDGGAPLARDFTNPIIALSRDCNFASLRNNVFMGVSKPENIPARPIISRGEKESDSDPRIDYADYNCFFNPQAPAAALYSDGLVKTPAAHDVKAEPKFTEGAVRLYPINEAEVWNLRYTVSQTLAYFRQRYTPAPGSPLIGAGDPADGVNSYIGAIAPGNDIPNDKFGRFAVK